MITIEKEVFEEGDKVRLSNSSEAWYRKLLPKRSEKFVGKIMTVKYQYGNAVRTDKGSFDFEELELVEE